MTAAAVIQARVGSTRLHGKVLLPLAGRSVLSWVIRAAVESRVFDCVVVATSTDPSDDPVANEAASSGAETVRGPLDDVLSRYILALDMFAPSTVARLTADCPFLDPELIRMCVSAFAAAELDYLSTTNPRSLPRGLDVEVCSADALRYASEQATGVDRVHVTSYLYRRPERFRTAGLVFSPPAHDLRVTLDTEDDYQALLAISAEIGDSPPKWRDLVRLLRARPDLVAMNAHVEQKGLEEG